jgi:hypothetical protein
MVLLFLRIYGQSKTNLPNKNQIALPMRRTKQKGVEKMKNILDFIGAVCFAVVVLGWLLIDGEARREFQAECDGTNDIY